MVIVPSKRGRRIELPLVVLGLALSFETVDTVHIIRLVVTTVEEEAVRTQPLVGVEQQSNLG